MSLRVIAGSARGRRLKRVPGDTTRPVMDRVKEACFSILGRYILDSRFLDLYAGTGSVGIEALSRGAQQAVFVENNRLAVKTIQENLSITQLGERAIIRRADVFAFLNAPPPADPFDYIYIAPPQYQNLWLKTLQTLEKHPNWFPDGTTVIVQIDPSEYQPFESSVLEMDDRRTYGKTMLIFMSRKIEENDAHE